MAPQDMFWGDRFARLQDAQGNIWEMGTHREDVAPRELKKRLVHRRRDALKHSTV